MADDTDPNAPVQSGDESSLIDALGEQLGEHLTRHNNPVSRVPYGTDGLHYARGTTPMHPTESIHAGADTTPATYGPPQQDSDALAELSRQLKLQRLADNESYRRFCSGSVAPSGIGADLSKGLAAKGK